MTYDWRVGTSISTSASRARNSAAAVAAVGAAGASIRNTLEGRCVNTIVFRSPMRLAIHAAARCETTFSSRAVKKRPASCASDMP